VASPSAETGVGREILAEYPNSPGSLGIAISEAVEAAGQHSDTKYSLGSVLNHVLLHQTVIGQEAMAQLEMAGDYPDIIVGCTGGGSNFAGIAFPFIGVGLRGGPKPRVIACEPAACPSLTRGKYAYDFGDTGHLTPLVKMHTLGSTFVPPGFHAGSAGQPVARARTDRTARTGTEQLLRGRSSVRTHRRDFAGSRGQSCCARHDRGSAALQS